MLVFVSKGVRYKVQAYILMAAKFRRIVVFVEYYFHKGEVSRSILAACIHASQQLA